MHFCSKCGMRIVKFVRKNDKNFGICAKGHETVFDLEKSYENLSVQAKNTSKSIIIVMDEGVKIEEQAITSIPCPHCGGRKSRLVRSFVLYGDEDQVTIMKCLECGKNFRVGKGVSGG